MVDEICEFVDGQLEKDDRSESETATNSEDDNVSYKPADGLPITGNRATNSAKNPSANGAAAVTTSNINKKNS